MTEEPEYMVRAIRAGCEAEYPNVVCYYPDCGCTRLAKVIRAAAPVLMDEARKEVAP